MDKNFFENRFLNMKMSPTLRANMKQAKSTKKIFKLGFGQSPFPVPQIMVKELQKQAHLKHYGASQGEVQLREAISDWLKRTYGIDYSKEQIVVSCGSKFFYYIFQMVFKGEIFLMSPCWVSYKPQGEICKKEAHIVPCNQGKFQDIL